MTHETTFGVIIVGDEILSGKRQDKHLPFIIELLHEYGHEPAWVNIVGDQQQLLTDCIRTSMQTNQVVFSFGGIGATPDDITRQCAAEAAGVKLHQHPEATALIQEVFGDQANERRLMMAEFPVGAEVIPNPVNKIAGFSLGNLHFVPGFPKMAHPMLRWVMQEKYLHLKREPKLEKICVVQETPESEMIPMMKTILAEHPEISLSSLPSLSNKRVTELGIKGPADKTRAAFADLCDLLEQDNINWQEKPD